MGVQISLCKLVVSSSLSFSFVYDSSHHIKIGAAISVWFVGAVSGLPWVAPTVRDVLAGLTGLGVYAVSQLGFCTAVWEGHTGMVYRNPVQACCVLSPTLVP